MRVIWGHDWLQPVSFALVFMSIFGCTISEDQASRTEVGVGKGDADESSSDVAISGHTVLAFTRRHYFCERGIKQRMILEAKTTYDIAEGKLVTKRCNELSNPPYKTIAWVDVEPTINGRTLVEVEDLRFFVLPEKKFAVAIGQSIDGLRRESLRIDVRRYNGPWITLKPNDDNDDSILFEDVSIRDFGHNSSETRTKKVEFYPSQGQAFFHMESGTERGKVQFVFPELLGGDPLEYRVIVLPRLPVNQMSQYPQKFTLHYTADIRSS